MPKFSEKEKEVIYLKLKREAEKLFSVYGLKKVTVDDLVKSVGISKGAFYTFYESKEHLYMEINFETQIKIFASIEEIMKKSKIRNAKKFTEKTIKLTLEKFLENPILIQFNNETMEYLKRKLPEQFFSDHIFDDAIMIKKLEEHGISFLYSRETIVKVLHFVFMYALELIKDTDSKLITNILIDSIVDKIVDE